MRTIALVATVAGCGFSSFADGVVGGDDEPGCIFEVTAHVDPCTAPQPSTGLDALTDFVITNEASVDTGNGQIVGLNIVKAPPATQVDGVTIIWTRSLTITATGSLRGYGDNALAIVATDGIRIDGKIDVSSNASSKGAGGNPAACAEIAAGPGIQCLNHGASGGGGGGFGAVGGAGGAGGVGHNCPTNVGKPGGVGGRVVALPALLRGGCSGADGERSDNPGSLKGLGGAGGGAVALVAKNKIVVAGLVHAGGAAGLSGVERAGGGGGGAGGMIVLAAIEVYLETGSILAANGGGGAGGVEGGTAGPAENGLPVIDDDADGGDPDTKSGKGGFGGYAELTNGTVGMPEERGGGGGGGGVGFIRVVKRTGYSNGGVSPPVAP